MKRLILRLICVFVGTTTIAIGGLIVTANANRQRAFDSLQAGASKAVVMSVMGTPDMVNIPCRYMVMWVDSVVVDKCNSEFQYNGIFLPEYWTVSFDPKDRAIGKYHHVSP